MKKKVRCKSCSKLIEYGSDYEGLCDDCFEEKLTQQKKFGDMIENFFLKIIFAAIILLVITLACCDDFRAGFLYSMSQIWK